ncbi:MAG: DNA mismatch repair protein MutS [Pseudomonadota bacterium]
MANAHDRAKGARPSDKTPPGPEVTASGPAKPIQKAERQSQPSPKPDASKKTTPSMAQYLEIKASNPDSLLWYRMGDFYELFFEDAIVASQALSITLTKRGKHLDQDIPMCGVPVVRADEYLERLIRQGYRVAVCEQLEDPAEARKRGSKAVVKRDVVRLVTPGTLTEDTLLDARSRNYLTALFLQPATRTGKSTSSVEGSACALASLDLSTGQCEMALYPLADLAGELARLAPGEVLLSQNQQADEAIDLAVSALKSSITPVPAAHFDSLAGERDLKQNLGVSELGAYGAFTRGELAAMAAVLKYVDHTQIGRKPRLAPPTRSSPIDIMTIDAATRMSLELTRTTSGEKAGSLLSSIDKTVTGAGARELAERISAPLLSEQKINERLDVVGFLLDQDTLRDDLRQDLRGAPDVARAISRLALYRGTPRDLAAVRDALSAAEKCAGRLYGTKTTLGLPGLLAETVEDLRKASGPLLEKLGSALVDDPPTTKRDGGFIRDGYVADLDNARSLRHSARQVIAELESRYAAETGIKALKVRHNNILGYFIEATQANAAPLTKPPHDAVFRHRQTMANAMRFVTDELVETEGRIATAAERALRIETEMFDELTAAIIGDDAGIQAVARALASLDVYASLAEVAASENMSRPIVEDTTAFEVRGGRHPVVEQSLRKALAGPFIENDCILSAPADVKDVSVRETEGGLNTDGSDDLAYPPGFSEATPARIWLVTGPNMAGKSTFLRQNAVIAILAQMGAYVPAKHARIGTVDRVFSRVGASDDLARGRSTFMVEMVETAAILTAAGPRSLVILDEIGRGTATFDGLSIAWACVEYLHDVCKARALFATHYHELTALPGRLDSVANVTIDVKEWQDEIVFLHKVKKGAADRSYGIQVAKLAGLPHAVVSRAGEVLKRLEAGDRKEGPARLADDIFEDLPLFAATRPTSPAATSTPDNAELIAEINNLQPDELTPRDALDALYRLKSLLAK